MTFFPAGLERDPEPEPELAAAVRLELPRPLSPAGGSEAVLSPRVPRLARSFLFRSRLHHERKDGRKERASPNAVIRKELLKQELDTTPYERTFFVYALRPMQLAQHWRFVQD